MSRQCDITGSTTIAGNHVSHANNKTKRVFKVNLHSKKYFIPSLKRNVNLRVSSKGMRIIDKLGIDHFASKLVAQGL